MIPPQTKSETANEEPPTSDYGLRNLISNVDAKEMYIDELKNTPLRCCCCNLWLVAHTLMILEILLRISSIACDLLNQEAEPHLQNAGVTVYLMIIIYCSVGMYGIRKCEPECIGAFIAPMIVGVSWFHMLAIGVCIIERKVIPIFVAIVVFSWIWYVPLIMIMWRVYKVARKYKYEAGHIELTILQMKVIFISNRINYDNICLLTCISFQSKSYINSFKTREND